MRDQFLDREEDGVSVVKNTQSLASSQKALHLGSGRGEVWIENPELNAVPAGQTKYFTVAEHPCWTERCFQRFVGGGVVSSEIHEPTVRAVDGIMGQIGGAIVFFVDG